MAQHDYDIANQSGANFRADLNNALDAIVSNNSGSSEPSTTFAYEWWIDTSANVLKLRNSANNAWITLPLSITADNSTSGALTVNGNLTTTGSVDINGQELILDADADTSITADTDDQIDFRLNGADKVVFDTSGIKLIHDDQKGLRFNTANTAESFIDFGDTDDDDVGRISYDHADNSISFRTSATQYLKISSQGTLNFTTPTSFSGQGNGVIGHHSNNFVYMMGGSAGLIFQDNNDGSNRVLIKNDNTIAFEVNGSDAAIINSSRFFGIGTTNPLSELHVSDAGDCGFMLQSTNCNTDKEIFQIIVGANASNEANLVFRTRANSGTGGTEIFRLDQSGNVLIGTTDVNVATQNSDLGVVISPSGRIFSTGDGHTDLNITSDGQIMRFRSGSTAEGNISISGALVSYNGFSGTHESSGIASNTVIGTVCSTIDELDTYLSGNKEGQTRTDHAKIKVSDTEGDSRVYGVLSSYSEEDNKPIVASVGIGSVLVTGACAGGDLLESNGDGTAKVQDDDIIRSKTIGKVTIGNSDTNVKLVSCVLYCG